ncbi:type VI secretion protein [Escherichia coli]|uniref:lytic transglycosylase domain-containing protein n=1 Tax=Escherichia coli TaxID=562 RepID=UPI0017B403B5|nr:lytic transglycosylase domain-containing protein [Escherichia coli]EFO2385205.1 type VI secretion protein [Escherichia coli]EJF6900581.1 lytic transglycosylase domain-containing protein [Escherichia coli]MBB9459880.1 lytic transglycosylase domain-containing protein [Escherichia coli]MCJ1134370.1 lytic transglycosylase domain-containing protein [Escherichia coli]
MLSTTAFLAVAMQCAATVHPSTSLDVARVESGYNPYAIAEIVPRPERKPGDKGFITHMPKSKEDAVSIITQIEAKGRRYSVGLMQITSTNFKRYGVTATDLFSPCINLSVYEKIITDCYRRGGTLERALSCYYSGNFSTGQQPETTLAQTSYVQRIGYSPDKPRYAVPGTREDNDYSPTTLNAVPVEASPDQQVIWPATVVRGVPAQLRQKKSPAVYYPAQIVRARRNFPPNKEEK